MPNTVPISRWPSDAQRCDTLAKKARRPVLRHSAQAALELGLRLIPILPAIGSKAAGIQLAQFALLGAEFASTAHGLVDADRLGLAGDGNEVELARLDDLLR